MYQRKYIANVIYILAFLIYFDGQVYHYLFFVSCFLTFSNLMHLLTVKPLNTFILCYNKLSNDSCW